MEVQPNNSIGFVYLIINRTTNRKYIGKKVFKYRNGKNSGWLNYVGSNKTLKEHAKRGDTLERIVLHLCSTQAELSYLEAHEQFKRFVLSGDTYYNEAISVRIKQHDYLTEKIDKLKKGANYEQMDFV